MTPTASEILAASTAYGSLEASATERLAGIGRVARLERGSALFRTGEECPAVFVMHSGVVRLSQTAPNGKMHVLRFAEAGGSFAEAAAIGGFRCPVDADVLEEAVALKIPSAALKERLKSDHDLCLELLRVMSRRNLGVVGRARDIALRDAAGRLAHFLLDRAGMSAETSEAVQLMVSKRELAQHLNLTSETLSRVFRRLSDQGVIDSDVHHEVRIVDPSRLRELAWEEPAN